VRTTAQTILAAAAWLLLLSLSGCVLPIPHITHRAVQISGRVIDAQSGQAVPGARVSIVNHPKTATVTDSRGNFATAADSHFSPVYISIPLPGDRVIPQFLVAKHPNYHTANRKVQFDVNRNSGITVCLPEPIRLAPR
jgi:hypothetical protein